MYDYAAVYFKGALPGVVLRCMGERLAVIFEREN